MEDGVGMGVSEEEAKMNLGFVWDTRAAPSDRVFVCSGSGHPQVLPQSGPAVRLHHFQGERRCRWQGGPRGQGAGPLTLPPTVLQSVLGAGYQALWLAQTLLAGQELMLRGLHWFV